MLITTSWSPGYPQCLSDLATNRRFPWPPPPWNLLFTRTAHRTHLPVYYIIKYMIKRQMNSQKKVRKARSGRVSSARASIPMDSRGTTLMLHDCVLQPGTSYYWDFREASSHGCDQLLTPLPAHLLSLENKSRAENSNFQSWLGDSADSL